MKAKFLEYCIAGRINEIKKMNINSFICYINDGFEWACMRGHTPVVKYFIESFLNNLQYEYLDWLIDRHTFYNGFYLACCYGRYDVVKYLTVNPLLETNLYYYINHSINGNKEEGFRVACVNEHRRIQIYLLTRYRKYDIYAKPSSHRSRVKPINTYLSMCYPFWCASAWN